MRFVAQVPESLSVHGALSETSQGARLSVLSWAQLPGPAFEALMSSHDVRVSREIGHIVASERAYSEAVDALIPIGEPRLSAELLDGFPAVRLISSFGLGLDHVDVQAATARGIAVCNTQGAVEGATAEFTIGLIVALLRRIVEGDALIRAGGWPAPGWPGAALDAMLGVGLEGMELGIVGLGGVGWRVARLARAHGMRVAYYQRHRADAAVEESVEARFCSLPLLLSEADVVSLHCPLTDETRHLLDRRALMGMKHGAFLVNASRGPVLDEAALLEALDSGRLAGVALDVFEYEPLVAELLRGRGNVVLTPHLGGATVRARADMTALVCRQIERLARGMPLDRIVNDVRRL